MLVLRWCSKKGNPSICDMTRILRLCQAASNKIQNDKFRIVSLEIQHNVYLSSDMRKTVSASSHLDLTKVWVRLLWLRTATRRTGQWRRAVAVYGTFGSEPYLAYLTYTLFAQATSLSSGLPVWQGKAMVMRRVSNGFERGGFGAATQALRRAGEDPSVGIAVFHQLNTTACSVARITKNNRQL